MKNLLVITYYFPPSGGPGVQRVLKHVKYLRQYGWNPIVFTVRDADYPAFDYSLMEEIPNDVEVIRSKIFEPYNFYRKLTGKKPGEPVDVNIIKKEGAKLSLRESFIEFIRGTFFIPDARIGWYFTGKKELKQVIDKFKIDAIYSSSPPYTCSLLAKYAQNKLGVPWIAGFRDPWTEFIQAPPRWFLPKYIDKSMEKSVFATANFVEVAWLGIKKDALQKYPDLPESKFVHIPNGFDAEDYPQIEYPENDVFTLTYTGSMYGKRNPKALFDAIELLLTEKKIAKEKFQLNFIGRFGQEVHQMMDETSFKDRIRRINYVPHSESIQKLLESDSLLLIVDESKESKEIVPGKVYEYLGTFKPLLVIAPERGAIADLIAETGAGLLAHQSNIDGIANNFLQLYKLWEEKKKLETINPEAINNYERKESARKLAKLLDELTK